MEEVWKYITLSCSLHDEFPTKSLHSLQHLPTANMALQDFLAGAAFEEPAARPSPPPLLPDQAPIDPNLMGSASNLDPNSHPFSICPKQIRHLDHQQPQHMCVNDIVNDEDRRQKRLMKNRGSASRSRARKQAYTHQLELDIAYLVQENAKLKGQCDKLRSAMAAQFSGKKTLGRTSSSSF